jgi:hypothetical protein
VGIHDLRAMVLAFVSLTEQGSQLLQDAVPRPCHVCGAGTYKPEHFHQSNPAFHPRLWNLSVEQTILTARQFDSSCAVVVFISNSSKQVLVKPLDPAED